MAKMNWERAASRERVRSGGGEPLEPIGSAASRHHHTWTDWKQPVFAKHWMRECRQCGLVQTRTAQPVKTEASSPGPTTRVARVKGPLIVRKMTGAVETLSPADATRAAKAAVEAGEVKANSGGKPEGFVRKGKAGRPRPANLTPAASTTSPAPLCPLLGFEEAVKSAIGRTITRPQNVARTGWVVSGKSMVMCSECSQLLRVIHRPGTADVIVLCRKCPGAWPLSDYSDQTRLAIKEFRQTQPHR